MCEQSYDIFNKPSAVSARGTVALLLYNTTEFAEACIESLQCHAPSDLTLVAVDNGSTENLAAKLAARFPSVVCLRVHHNRGVAGGLNAACHYGFTHATGRMYLMNDDAVVKPGFWQRCESILGEKGPGLVASVPLNFAAPHAIQSAGVDIDPSSARISWRRTGETYHEDVPDFETSDAFVGVGFMLDRAVWKKIGAFNECFGAFFEETDYCFRARKEGMLVGVANHSLILHHGSQTMGFPSARFLYHFLRNYLWYIRMHIGHGRLTVLKKAYSFFSSNRTVRRSRFRIIAMLRGLGEGFFRTPPDAFRESPY